MARTSKRAQKLWKKKSRKIMAVASASVPGSGWMQHRSFQQNNFGEAEHYFELAFIAPFQAAIVYHFNLKLHKHCPKIRRSRQALLQRRPKILHWVYYSRSCLQCSHAPNMRGHHSATPRMFRLSGTVLLLPGSQGEFTERSMLDLIRCARGSAGQ